MDKLRFLEELDFITIKCAEMAQEYAMLRGAMDSLDGLEGKFKRDADLKSSTIRFFNETKNLRISRLIGVVWALSERASKERVKLSSLSSAVTTAKTAKFDRINFSGDMTLMRLCNMYRRAVELHPDIVMANTVWRRAALQDSEVSEITLNTSHALDDLCSQIEAHLSDDNSWHKIEHFRNSAAHSLKYSNVTIDKEWTDFEPDFKYNELYYYGNRAAQIAIDFRRVWNLSSTYSGVDEVAKLIKEDYDEFWKDFFENDYFYRV